MSAPRWTGALLRRLAPPEAVEDVLGDLEEAHRGRVQRRGPRIASVLTAIEALDMAMALIRGSIAKRLSAGGAGRGATQPEPASPSRVQSTGRLMDARMSLLDFKLGVRMLIKYPGLTFVGGLALAFAIAVGAATFEFTTQFSHPRLPLPDGDRIVGIRNWNTATSRSERRSLHDFVAWREELESVEDLGAFRTIERNLITGDGSGAPVQASEISASAFRVARVPPLLGRTLVAADEQAGAPPVVVLGYDVWQTRFAGDPDIIGQTVRLGNTAHTVVGVMPRDFAFPVNDHLWVPLRLNRASYKTGEGPGIRMFGRLAPGATLEEARAELAALGRRAAAEFPDTHRRLRPQVMPYGNMILNTSDDPEFRAGAYLSNAFVVMFLLLVCSNVATLVFARAATRENELTVRNALGASRGRIITQLFAEALVLGAVAAALGLAAAALGVRSLGQYAKTRPDFPLPFFIHAGLGPETVLYAGLLTVLVAVIAGIVPALKVTGRGVERRLRTAAVGGASRRSGRMWAGVIIAQVAFTVVFLPVLIGTWSKEARFETTDVGFPAEEYLSARVEMDHDTSRGPSGGSSDAAFRARFRTSYQELERRLIAQPAVTGVTFATRLPGGDHPRRLIEVEGMAPPPGSTLDRQSQTAQVDVHFFDVLSAPILSGRAFHSGDLQSDARVVIVNDAFVRHFLGGRNAIGQRVRSLCSAAYCRTLGHQPGPWYEIVGVVQELALTPDPDLPHHAGMYYPVAPDGAYPIAMAVHVRGEPALFAPRLRALASAVDPTLRLDVIRPLNEVRADGLKEYVFFLRIAILAGGVILLLSTVGIYAVTSFTVSRRTREIGIRVALGADRRRIVAAIFSRTLAQLGIGVAVGVGLLTVPSLASGGTLSARIIVLIAAGVSVMVGAAMVACIVPVRRALRIEPTEALQAQ